MKVFQEFQSYFTNFEGGKDELKELLNRLVKKVIRVRKDCAIIECGKKSKPASDDIFTCLRDNKEMFVTPKNLKEDIIKNLDQIISAIEIQPISITLRVPGEFENNIFETLRSICTKNQTYLGESFVIDLLSKCEKELLDKVRINELHDDSVEEKTIRTTQTTRYSCATLGGETFDNLAAAIRIVNSYVEARNAQRYRQVGHNNKQVATQIEIIDNLSL